MLSSLSLSSLSLVSLSSLSRLSLSLSSSPGGDGLALVSSWGEAIGVCHCPDYHHSWGALSDPGVLSLSPTCPLSLSLSLCVYLSSWKRSLVAAARGLCYAPCQAHAVQCIHANRTIAGNNDASGWQAGQSFRHIFVNRKPPASLCERLGTGMASASGRGGSGGQPCSRLV